MDFSKFEAVDSSNVRKAGNLAPKEQQYTDMKYRKALNKNTKEVEGRFYISNAKFKELGIAAVLGADGAVTSKGKGLRQFTSTENGNVTGVAIGLVSDDDAKILKLSKRGKKSTNFKSTKLETALAALKVIDPSKEGVNQFIDLVLAASNVTVSKIACEQVFTLKPGAQKPATVKPTPIEGAAQTATAETAAVNTEAAAPQAQPAKTAEAGWE